MKKTLLILALAAGTFAACSNSRGDSDTDDKDSINASPSQDTLLQDSLQADTSAKSSNDAAAKTTTSNDTTTH